MTDKSAKTLSKEYVRKELESADKISELITNYSQEEIEESMVHVVEEIVPKIEDPFREQQVYRVLLTVGQATGSEEMVKEGQRLLDKWSEKYN